MSKGKGFHDFAAEGVGKIDDVQGNAVQAADVLHVGKRRVIFDILEKTRMQGRDRVSLFLQKEQSEQAVGSSAYGDCDVHGQSVPSGAHEGKAFSSRRDSARLFVAKPG